MALVYKFVKESLDVDVSYVMDAFNGHSRFLIADVLNYDSSEDLVGFQFQVGEFYWYDEFVSFAREKGLFLHIYNNNDYVGSPFIPGAGYVSSSVNISYLTVVFDEPVVIDTLEGIFVTVDGDAIAPVSVLSGDGTAEVTFVMEGNVLNGEEAKLDIYEDNGILSVSEGLPARAARNKDITNNTPLVIAPQFERAEIGGDILYITFDVTVNASGATGISLTSDGDPITVAGVNTSDSSDTVLFDLSREIVDGETITLTVNAVNNIARVNGSVLFEGCTDESVLLNFGLTPYVNFGSYVNFGTYVKLD